MFGKYLFFLKWKLSQKNVRTGEIYIFTKSLLNREKVEMEENSNRIGRKPPIVSEIFQQ